MPCAFSLGVLLFAGSGAAQAGPRAAPQHTEDVLALCADCHPGQEASYAETGMARALGPLRAGELAGLEPVLEDATGLRYSLEGDGTSARIVESRAAEDGRPALRDSGPLVFAIGAGERDRSFVLARSRRLWLAPLEVLTAGGKRHAALAPSHSIGPGTRFTLPVTPECLGCHTDAPPPRAWPLNLQPADWTPRGISCGGCHAGLVEHVRFRSQELGGESPAGSDPILDPHGPGRIARMEICAACHLQGDARIELVPGRLGPPPPGSPLLATRAVFVAREPSEEIGFVSQVQRLVLSRCYLESSAFPQGGLSCVSCHDPHRSVFAPEERARVRAACLDCHGADAGEHGRPASGCSSPVAERPSGRDCADCHLRRTGVFDVAEVEIHDHWIRRRPGGPSPAKPLRFPESRTGDWRIFAWPDAPLPAHGNDPGLWAMALSHGGHVERALEFLRQGPGAFADSLAMLHHVRGSLLERSGQLPEARAAYERALALDPEQAESATNLGPLLARLGDARGARSLLDGLVARYPRADSALRNRAVVRLGQGDEAGCLGDLEAAMMLLPDAELASALARICEQRGDHDAAQRWSEVARRLAP